MPERHKKSHKLNKIAKLNARGQVRAVSERHRLQDQEEEEEEEEEEAAAAAAEEEEELAHLEGDQDPR